MLIFSQGITKGPKRAKVFCAAFRLTISSLLFTSSTIAVAEALILKPFTASYRGEALGLSQAEFGERKLFQVDQNHYRFESAASAYVYSAQESSDFSWENNQAIPQSYRSETQTLFKTRKNRIHFDHAAKIISYTYKKKSGTMQLEGNIQDPLTSFITLASRLAAGETTISVAEAKGRKIKHRTFQLIDTPTLLTERAGAIKTYHLALKDEDPKRQTEVWLHHQYPYIAVRIKQLDDDDQFLLELTDFKLSAK